MYATKTRRHVHAATTRALETWAAQKRIALVGKDQGFAPRSIVDKLRKEREGAGEAWKPHQVIPNLYERDGARVQQVIVTLPGLTRMVVTCYYLFRGPYFIPVYEARDREGVSKQGERRLTQVEALGIGKSEYWSELYAGQMAIEAGMTMLERMVVYRSA